jgi:hypothetical protein
MSKNVTRLPVMEIPPLHRQCPHHVVHSRDQVRFGRFRMTRLPARTPATAARQN